VSAPRMIFGLALLAAVGASDRAPAARAQEQAPTFRSATTVVEVDVVVRDGKRQFVADLTAGDFEILDDGVPQEVSALYRVIGPGDQLMGTPEPPPLPPPPPQQVQRVIVLFFDQAHMQPGGVDRARQAAVAFVQGSFRQGDVGGVIDGSRMVGNRLTGVKEELVKAVQGIRPAPEMSQALRELREWPRFVDVVEAWRVTRNERGVDPGPTLLDDVTERACRDRPGECENEAARATVEATCQSKSTGLVSQARQAGKMTISTVETLANGLARLPGRKTVIMLSEGFFTEDSWADLKAVVGRAARASVRIYAIDPRGLNRGSASSDTFSQESPNAPGALMNMQFDTNADGPNSLAVDTGGYVIRNENDFGKAFTEIDRDTSSYYIVGFKRSQPVDGKYHSLSVRVKRSGVSVRARKGYVASADGLPSALPAGMSEPPAAAARVPSSVASPPVAVEAPPVPAAAAAAIDTGTVVRSDGRPAVGGAVRAAPHSALEVERLRDTTASAKSGAPLPDALRRQAEEGWEAYRKGDVDTARTRLLAVAAQPAAPPWVHYVLGWSELALGRAAPASANWEKVRVAVPQFEAVYFDLADAYQRQGELAKAVAVMRDAEGRWPRDVEVYSALGVIQLARGAVDDAVGTFTKAVSIAPTDANACYNLAKTYEVRSVRAERMRKVGPGSGAGATALDDRSQAVAYYQKVVALGGPLAEQAKEALKRLGQ
jgi:VWFA-related protein